MPIVSLVNLKGGVGKSTAAVHLATYLAQESRALLIDSDKQGSAASWAVWREEAKAATPTVVRLYDKELITQGKKLAGGYDWTIIDTRGSDSVSTRAALVLSDLALVPLRDSEFDAAAIDDLLVVIGEAQSLNPDLKVLAYLSQVDKRAKFPADHKAFLAERGVQCADAYLSFRRSYIKAAGGKLVDEVGDSTAAAEMSHLLHEVQAILAATTATAAAA
jgi:chromosome partitioning protein